MAKNIFYIYKKQGRFYKKFSLRQLQNLSKERKIPEEHLLKDLEQELLIQASLLRERRISLIRKRLKGGVS